MKIETSESENANLKETLDPLGARFNLLDAKAYELCW